MKMPQKFPVDDYVIWGSYKSFDDATTLWNKNNSFKFLNNIYQHHLMNLFSTETFTRLSGNCLIHYLSS